MDVINLILILWVVTRIRTDLVRTFSVVVSSMQPGDSLWAKYDVNTWRHLANCLELDKFHRTTNFVFFFYEYQDYICVLDSLILNFGTLQMHDYNRHHHCTVIFNRKWAAITTTADLYHGGVEWMLYAECGLEGGISLSVAFPLASRGNMEALWPIQLDPGRDKKTRRKKTKFCTFEQQRTRKV